MAGPLLTKPPTGVGSGLAVGQHFAHEIVPDPRTAIEEKFDRRVGFPTDVTLYSRCTETAGDFGEWQVHAWIVFVWHFFRGLLNREFATARNPTPRSNFKNGNGPRNPAVVRRFTCAEEFERSQCRLQNLHQAARQ
jgi:hypothetical protein